MKVIITFKMHFLFVIPSEIHETLSSAQNVVFDVQKKRTKLPELRGGGGADVIFVSSSTSSANVKLFTLG